MSSSIDPNIDPHGYLGLIRNKNGSITRKPDFLPNTPVSSDPNDSNPVITKDIPINPENKTWARLYLPRPGPDAITPTSKLPLIVYFHGGGFILCSAATSMFQKFCCEIVKEIPAVMLSVDYRLGPEHRLPAAYDDSVEALNWIRASDEEWLTKYADFSNCYLMGTSAGDNIVYHVGLRVAASGGDRLLPLKIKGLILHQPFFGGAKRCPSEIRLANDKVFPPIVADIMWEFGLPEGVGRDHEYCNPMVNIRVKVLEKVKELGWKVLVTGCDGDPVVDRQMELVKVLEENGVEVCGKFSEGGSHGYEFVDDSSARICYDVLKKFIVSDL